MTLKGRALIVVTSVLAICAGFAGYLLYSASTEQITQRLPSLAPPPAEHALGFWSFTDLAGAERQMTEWTGKLVVVNFWATWCGPCRREIPGFVALQARYAAEHVQFIGIALDRAEPVQTFATEHGINYPLLIGEENVSKYMAALGNTIGALPFSAVIDRAGRVVEIHQGEWSEAEVDKIIRRLL